jgi:putative oxidoreductase
MSISHAALANIGRIGVGFVFLISATLDIAAKQELFALMKKKRVSYPRICFVGAVSWKVITSLGLITNFFAYESALLLAFYIFLANLVFNNFWAAPKAQFNFSFAMFLIHIATCFGLLAIAASC